MHPMKLCDIVLAVLWAVVGIVALFGEQISKWTFVCLLICYLCEVGIKIITNKYDDNNDNNRPGLA